MTARVLRPFNRHLLESPSTVIRASSPRQQLSRTFLLGASAPQTLNASRTLPYPCLAIYDIIADIEAYPSFVPYCRSASVVSWSQKDSHYQRTWPQRASLTIGYGGKVTEAFTSRVFCVPPIPEPGRAGVGYVEALSGKGEHQMKDEHVDHHDHGPTDIASSSPEESPMEMLKTRWTVRAFPFKPAPQGGSTLQDGAAEPAIAAKEMTDVSLSIEYKFKNPMYDIMSRAVAPKLADMMIEAFEKRVNDLLKNRANLASSSGVPP